MVIRKLLCPLIIAVCGLPAYSQGIALKSNILSDAFLNINVGAEATIAPKWSVDLTCDFNAWTVDTHKWKHWVVQPELRYWFCDPFAGHFIGAHLLGGQYNIGNINNGINFLGTDFSRLSNERFQGWFVGAGIAYGFAWVLGRHWNIEAEIGFGWTYTRYESYPCTHCGNKIDNNRPHNYVGPTKAALNIVYLF